jgi:WD40 repeat protein
LVYSPDGSLLVSGGGDGLIHLWDPATGARRGTFADHCGAVRSLAFTPDGVRMLSSGDDGRIRVWEVATRRFLGWIAVGPNGRVYVAPDGSHHVEGDVRGWFWLSDGVHRFEVGELDRWIPGLRIRGDEPFPWGREALPERQR